ncbi:MAG: cyclohexa-1,5-dienecarbonyl-CoA hydratase [Gammaproteobacteria bacterium]|nr:cyclohexa-1,5-dienecarbonyl-CoA hydratase [Gammaproteobacteria bacterium]
MSGDPVRWHRDRDGRLLRLTLARPRANIVDTSMIAALGRVLADHAGDSGLLAVLLAADGPNFSFGASVEEHFPEHCRDMLAGLHALIKRLLDYPVPILVAIQGQCLGGGLEIALAGSLLFGAPDARMGQPEIRIGVFAPAASCLLPARVGQSRAEDLLYSGRSIGAEDALAMNLLHAISDDPVAAALAYFDQYLAGLSACSLRFAHQAARGDYSIYLKTRLDAVEKLYLERLMSTHDAVEGLNAFVEKRPPRWQHR